MESAQTTKSSDEFKTRPVKPGKLRWLILSNKNKSVAKRDIKSFRLPIAEKILPKVTLYIVKLMGVPNIMIVTIPVRLKAKSGNIFLHTTATQGKS